jgi:hypothetical protein
VLPGPDYLQLDPHYLQRARKQRPEPTLFANGVSALISKSLVSSFNAALNQTFTSENFGLN